MFVTKNYKVLSYLFYLNRCRVVYTCTIRYYFMRIAASRSGYCLFFHSSSISIKFIIDHSLVFLSWKQLLNWLHRVFDFCKGYLISWSVQYEIVKIYLYHTSHALCFTPYTSYCFTYNICICLILFYYIFFFCLKNVSLII